MENKETCGSRIREALRLRDMTQADLCRATGIPKSAMSQYCNDVLAPRQDRTYLIAKALSVTEPWLMGFDVQMERDRTKKSLPATPGEEAALDHSLITKLLALTPEEQEKVVAFVQGLIAARPGPLSPQE